MKNIIIRALSGSVYVAMIVASLMLLDNSPIAYLAVFSLFVALGIKEIYDMTNNADGSDSWLIIFLDMLGGIGLFVGFYMESTSPNRMGFWFLPVVAYLLLRCIVQLYRPKQNAVRSLERSFFSILYVAWPVALLNYIMSVSEPRMLLAIFVFIWINDTGAFLSGILLGKHRLFERISPKKSWEGFFGGLLACVLSALAFNHWCNEFFQVPDLFIWVGLSIVVSVMATFGDLVESLIKRTEGVKDSGHIIPGHGGVLDRIDSLLLVSPAVFIYLVFITRIY